MPESRASLLRRFQPTPEKIRSRVADVNDGVLAVAGLAEGLAVMDMGTLPVIVTIGVLAGTLAG